MNCLFTRWCLCQTYIRQIIPPNQGFESPQRGLWIFCIEHPRWWLGDGSVSHLYNSKWNIRNKKPHWIHNHIGVSSTGRFVFLIYHILKKTIRDRKCHTTLLWMPEVHRQSLSVISKFRSPRGWWTPTVDRFDFHSNVYSGTKEDADQTMSTLRVLQCGVCVLIERAVLMMIFSLDCTIGALFGTHHPKTTSEISDVVCNCIFSDIANNISCQPNLFFTVELCFHRTL